jgi:hypothetical protein
MIWIRTCQECGHRQETKPPAQYKGDSWTELKCKRCKSLAMDYGSELNEGWDKDWKEGDD